jgi:addiction module RelE/StbE family toxin
MKVQFTDRASGDLDSIRAYIARDRPTAAASVIRRIRETALQLSDFPELGRPGTGLPTRELGVRGLPYILIYTVDESAETVLILNIFHGAQNRPRGA